MPVKTRMMVVVLLAGAALLTAVVVAGIVAGGSGGPAAGGAPAEEAIDSAFGVDNLPIPVEGGCAIDGACVDPRGPSAREETP